MPWRRQFPVSMVNTSTHNDRKISLLFRNKVATLLSAKLRHSIQTEVNLDKKNTTEDGPEKMIMILRCFYFSPLGKTYKPSRDEIIGR